MGRRQGFTIVELIVTMAILGIALTLIGRFFADQLMTFKQQAKISESNIEGIAGLELLRRDVEHAGYGLPWTLPAGVAYSEAAAAPGNAYNNCSGVAPCPAPSAILSGNGSVLGGSDYLVVKAVNVGVSDSANKWTLLQSDLYSTYNLKSWTSTKDENLGGDEKVIVLTIGGEDPMRSLVSLTDAGGTFYAKYVDVATNVAKILPTVGQIRIVYGVATADTAVVSMPFNRADFYISSSGVPSTCAPNTGVLTKATINQEGGGSLPMPLLDCVADMQVVFGVDSDVTADGIKDCYTDNLADVFTVNDANIRSRVKEVRVYVLAHEGQADRTFSFSAPVGASSIRVGALSAELGLAACNGTGAVGRVFDLSTTGSNWRNYRWKVYTMVVTPHNLL